MSKKALRLHPQDNCVVALADVSRGETVVYEGGELVAASDVAIAHKLAIGAIGVGDKVYKYGASIGSASAPIAAGEHIHTHNLASDYLVGFHH